VGTFGGWITSASHPDNPFGDALCGSNPDCTTPQDVATSRRLTESGGRLFTQEVDTWRISLGLDGEFYRGWTWDANYLIAKWNDSQRDEGRPNRPNIEAMMDPDLCAAAGDCPGVYNPFISNSMTPEQVAYGFVGVNTKEESKLNVFQLNFSGGTTLELPGGEIMWAVGYENRRESAASSPDGGAAIGAIAFTPGETTGGKFEVDEYYGEVVFPIFQGAPFAEVLAVEASYRVSDVDFLDDKESIYKVAVEWAPIDDIRFRTTFSEGFRAPNISELFLGQQQSAESYTDPCRNYGTTPGLPASTVANCRADGLPADFNIATFQATTLQGGNPDLEPETSESFTFGLVFTPSFIENLVVSLDYFDIEIEDAIGTAPTSEVISSCYASAGFTDPLCALIVGPAFPGVDETPSPAAPGRRNSNQQISGVLQTNANLASYNTSGYDFAIDWGIETGIGMLDLTVSGTYLEEYDYIPFSGGDVVELAGFFGGDPAFGNPAAFADWRINYGATLTRDNWGGSLMARYMADTEDRDAAPGNLENTADDVTYLDAQGYFKWENMTFTIGVRNLTDEEPPYVTAYDDMNTIQYSYDTQGRYYYARANLSF
jgi:iron complex outermembrane recepter protein